MEPSRRLILACLLASWPVQVLANAGQTAGPGPRKLVVLQGGHTANLGLPGAPKATFPQIILSQYRAFLLNPVPQLALQGLEAAARTPSTSEERSAARLLLTMIAQPSRMPPSLALAVSQGLGEEDLSTIAATADSVAALAEGNAKLSLALLRVRQALPDLIAAEMERAESLARSFFDAAKAREQAAVDARDVPPQPRPEEARLVKSAETALAERAPDAAPPAPKRVERKANVPATSAAAQAEYRGVLAALEAMYAKQASGYRDAYDSRRGLVYRIPYNDDAAAHIEGLENRRADLEEAYPELGRPAWRWWLGGGPARATLAAVALAAFLLSLIATFWLLRTGHTPWSVAAALLALLSLAAGDRLLYRPPEK